ncbi:Cochaperone protein [Dionaea muscipula]
MASDLETKGKEAFIDDDFELAIDLYSQAIDLDASNVVLFADRAQANIKLNNFNEENCTLSNQQVQKAPIASTVSVLPVNNSSLGITSAKPKIRHDFLSEGGGSNSNYIC